MRILLVSDIHANWVALKSIQEPFDVCLFLGDLVDYGLQPAPCIEWICKNATYYVRGNHDHGVAQRVEVQGGTGFRYLTAITRPHSWDLVSEAHRRFLAGMPITQLLTIDRKRVMMVHGSPRDPLDEFAPADPEFWAKRLEGIDVDLICVGHTHQPYVLQVGKTTVVNPGSVGLPRDGDPRAGYAIIDDLNIELKRIEYPVEEAVEVIRQSRLPELAKDMLVDVYRKGRLTARIPEPLPTAAVALSIPTPSIV